MNFSRDVFLINKVFLHSFFPKVGSQSRAELQSGSEPWFLSFGSRSPAPALSLTEPSSEPAHENRQLGGGEAARSCKTARSREFWAPALSLSEPAPENCQLPLLIFPHLVIVDFFDFFFLQNKMPKLPIKPNCLVAGENILVKVWELWKIYSGNITIAFQPIWYSHCWEIDFFGIFLE